jgi:hypothetical protein
LSLVNLIAGINGLGKTAILEAFFFYSGAGNPAPILRGPLGRGISPLEESPGVLWKSLFRQSEESQQIRLVGVDSLAKKRTLSITMMPSAAALPMAMSAAAVAGLDRDVEGVHATGVIV